MGGPAQRLSDRVVLVVEDEDAVRRITARILRDAGLRVLEASDGQSAVASLASLGPAVIGLVVSDIAMPVMSGLELAAVIQERWPDIPILLISAHGAPPSNYPGSFLSKPYSPDTLVAAVTNLLPPALTPQ
jgi:two-component system, NtrC family, C4-dicarboxylate transport response regulator DctD